MGLLKQMVSNMRLRHVLPIAMLMLFSGHISAGEKLLIGTPLAQHAGGKQEKKWYYPFEIPELKIKQSNDGTGIISDVSCGDCDYQFVKLTRDTEVIVNARKTHLLRARERAGMSVFIKFDKKTAEVKYIYWSE
jgi:hypothetical protein